MPILLCNGLSLAPRVQKGIAYHPSGFLVACSFWCGVYVFGGVQRYRSLGLLVSGVVPLRVIVGLVCCGRFDVSRYRS